MMLFLTMILPEVSCSGLKRLRFLQKAVIGSFLYSMAMELFPDSHLQGKIF